MRHGLYQVSKATLELHETASNTWRAETSKANQQGKGQSQVGSLCFTDLIWEKGLWQKAEINAK